MHRSAKLVAKALGPNSTEVQLIKGELSEKKVMNFSGVFYEANINPLSQGVGSSERRLFGVLAQLQI